MAFPLTLRSGATVCADGAEEELESISGVYYWDDVGAGGEGASDRINWGLDATVTLRIAGRYVSCGGRPFGPS